MQYLVLTVATCHRWQVQEEQTSGMLQQPSARTSASVVATKDGTFGYLFGGRGVMGHLNDLYEFNDDSHQWTLLVPHTPSWLTSSTPSPRHGAGMVIADKRLVVYGGVGVGSGAGAAYDLNYVWEFPLPLRKVHWPTEQVCLCAFLRACTRMCIDDFVYEFVCAYVCFSRDGIPGDRNHGF